MKEAVDLQHRLVKPNSIGKKIKAKIVSFFDIVCTNFKITVTRGLGVPALKTAMEWFGYYGGPVRRPLLPLNSEEETRVKKAFEDEGFLA